MSDQTPVSGIFDKGVNFNDLPEEPIEQTVLNPKGDGTPQKVVINCTSVTQHAKAYIQVDEKEQEVTQGTVITTVFLHSLKFKCIITPPPDKADLPTQGTLGPVQAPPPPGRPNPPTQGTLGPVQAPPPPGRPNPPTQGMLGPVQAPPPPGRPNPPTQGMLGPGQEPPPGSDWSTAPEQDTEAPQSPTKGDASVNITWTFIDV